MEHMIRVTGFRMERTGKAKVRVLRFLYREREGGRG